MCRPTRAVALGADRFIHNWALRLRTDAYYDRHERMGYHEASAALTALKQQPETAWLNEVSSVPLQQALRHMDKAFRNFFEGRAGYPAFHKKHGRQAATYASSAFRWDAETRALTSGEDGHATRHPLVAVLHWNAHHCHHLQRHRWALLRLVFGRGRR